MMRFFMVLLALTVTFATAACSEEEGAQGEASAEEGQESEEKTPEGEEKKAEGEEKKAEGEEKKAEGDEKKAEGEDQEAEAAAPAEVSKPKVSEEDCKSACALITTLTLSGLPAETKEEAKAKIKEALVERCPADCLKHGTPESMKCVLAAKTAVDLAACPK